MVYITKGINRRKQDEDFSEIFDSYIKILQVNLDSGDFDIIKMDIGEKEEACGFSGNIKEWLHHFAQCGMVHQEDLAVYMEKTDPDSWKAQFVQGKAKAVRVYYRRQIGNAYRNVMLEVMPKKDFSAAEPIVFLYVKDMETENHAEEIS